MPSLVQQQQLKWSVQWSLRVPPAAAPIVPVGQAAILVCRNKILFFVSILFKQFQIMGVRFLPEKIILTLKIS